MTDFFLELTPDRVLMAVEDAGFAPTGHCTPLTCLENRVYDLRLEDDRHIVSKFYRPGRWTREAILEEHRFLADLREAEIQVCAPLRFPDGETLREVEGIQFAIWPRTGGRSPDELADDQIQILGRLLARIHNVGATRDATH
ncbi:MAG: phosphotransferase, partial [Myxococcota bacterium]